MAAGHSVDPLRWRAAFDELVGRSGGRVWSGGAAAARSSGGAGAGAAGRPARKNCWTIPEHAGTTSPDGLQHLLARAVR